MGLLRQILCSVAAEASHIRRTQRNVYHGPPLSDTAAAAVRAPPTPPTDADTAEAIAAAAVAATASAVAAAAAACVASAACLVQRPFGGDITPALDDAASARSSPPIHVCAFFTGGVLSDIQLDYDGHPGLRYGTDAGVYYVLVVAPNEFITKAMVQRDTGHLLLTTTSGRDVALGPILPDDPRGPPFVSATPTARHPASSGRPLVLGSISGVAGKLLDTLTFTWMEYPLTTGPFGNGSEATGSAFDDFSLSSSGDGLSSPVTAVRIWSGCWMDAIQVDCHGQPGLKHGGNGGAPVPALLTLEPGEHITSATVWKRYCGRVAAIVITTCSGRSMHMGAPCEPRSTRYDATPKCGTSGGRIPVLVAVSGVGNDFVDSLTFHWAFPIV